MDVRGIFRQKTGQHLTSFFLVVFTIPIGCPREVRCPRNVRGVFWLHVFITFWMQHLTWRLRSFCIALACSLGVFLPWRKLCFSPANGATQSNCSIKQRLYSENPMWNSCSRFPSRAWRTESALEIAQFRTGTPKWMLLRVSMQKKTLFRDYQCVTVPMITVR